MANITDRKLFNFCQNVKCGHSASFHLQGKDACMHMGCECQQLEEYQSPQPECVCETGSVNEYCPIHRSTIPCSLPIGLTADEMPVPCVRPVNHIGACSPGLRKYLQELKGEWTLPAKSHISVVYTQQRLQSGFDAINQPLHIIQHFACVVTVITVVGTSALPQVAGVFFGLDCFAQGDTLAEQIKQVSGLEIVKTYPTAS